MSFEFIILAMILFLHDHSCLPLPVNVFTDQFKAFRSAIRYLLLYQSVILIVFESYMMVMIWTDFISSIRVIFMKKTRM